MTTPEERLKHDVVNGIRARVAFLLGCNDEHKQKEMMINDQAESIARNVIDELRIRWTIIERPRKQRTLRQDS